MDIATIGGLIAGFIFIILGILFGGASPLIYWDAASVMITIGGSFSALMVANPLSRVLASVKYATIATRVPKLELERIIRILVEFSERARREGLLALEDNLQELDDEFMRKGIQLVVDGTDPEIIKSILYNELNQIQERHATAIKVFEDWGKLAPAFGMIGTLIGLVAMLTKLEDKSSIGQGMAVALITTLYGAILANLVLIPIGAKLVDRDKMETLTKEIIIEGILSIQSGDNPRILLEKLIAFLPPAQRESLKQESGKE
jgi:chemotaxis protein MotA